MNSLSLYEISNEYRRMVEALMETQEDAAAIADTIEAEEWPLVTKAQNVAYAIRNLEASAEAIKQAEQQMAERRKRIEKRAEAIRTYLQNCMELAGVQKIDCPHFTLSIAKNPASVEIYEAALVPDGYHRYPEPPPPVIDKTAIKEAIKAGIDVPGARMTQGTRLSIR